MWLVMCGWDCVIFHTGLPQYMWRSDSYFFHIDFPRARIEQVDLKGRETGQCDLRIPNRSWSPKKHAQMGTEIPACPNWPWDRHSNRMDSQRPKNAQIRPETQWCQKFKVTQMGLEIKQYPDWPKDPERPMDSFFWYPDCPRDQVCPETLIRMLK